MQSYGQLSITDYAYNRDVFRSLSNIDDETFLQNIVNGFSLAHATLLKKTLAQAFSCHFCEISQNIFFTKHLWTTASEHLKCRSLQQYLTGFVNYCFKTPSQMFVMVLSTPLEVVQQEKLQNAKKNVKVKQEKNAKRKCCNV